MVHQPKLSAITTRRDQHYGASAAGEPEDMDFLRIHIPQSRSDSDPVLSRRPTPINGFLKSIAHGTNSSAPTRPHTSTSVFHVAITVSTHR